MKETVAVDSETEHKLVAHEAIGNLTVVDCSNAPLRLGLIPNLWKEVKGVFIPKVEILRQALSKQVRCARLEEVQRAACVGMTRCLRSTPTMSLEEDNELEGEILVT
uniref:Uncharacterized protein n=1 Tax=Megaselia scalaris TaxID=36166 RepID=T1GE89_MEGSC